ncbi:cytochrome C oxidase Cbb3 [Methylobacterium sp. NI91]|nr:MULTISPECIES: cytochrome C oxidase Cbb3 [unclassified Methylobacterium]QIJ77526.1 cytochrome C oxidase Cbb3 [Methylobacterium sp. CLZ]QIJ82429.1 cytochrome C oxidase Cbb3 [Methylobacterium sp. NI91]
MAWPLRIIVISAVAAGAVIAVGAVARVSYAPMPDEGDLLNPGRYPLQTAYDILGRRVARDEAERLKATPEGRNDLSAEKGAVAIDDALVKRGRDAFYRETFGNEVFLSDVMGMLDGGVTPYEVARAILLLGGAGTTNLQVRMARDVTVGDRVWKAGELVPTGLDVPRGSAFILGIRTFYDRGRLRMGITCALCHAAFDPASGKVVEGAPNTDLNAGLLMALASNATAYFMHGSVDPSAHPSDPSRSVTTEEGGRAPLPDRAAFEAAAKVEVASWPAGSFDSSADRETNPTSIPSSFSAYAEPYSWSGRAGVGPFKGLSALNNNVHAANSDTTQQTQAAKILFGLDPQVYLGMVLQCAAAPSLRYDPASGKRPTELLEAADPTPGTPGLNSYAVLPSFPATNYMTDNGLLASVPGEPANYANNAMSAFQNLLRAPDVFADAERVKRGRAVFERVGCAGCHAGPALSNNRVIPVEEIGTQPSRARSTVRMEARLAPPAVFATDTPFPLPPDPKLVPIPVEGDALKQLQLAWAHAGTRGGYKVQNLVGLAWSAPYLHDSGVAVGPDAEKQLGVPGTLDAGIAPDPTNSLRALVDRGLRARIVAANVGSQNARTARVTGEGHSYWADAAAGVSDTEQSDLVAYLLSVNALTEPVPVP